MIRCGLDTRRMYLLYELDFSTSITGSGGLYRLTPKRQSIGSKYLSYGGYSWEVSDIHMEPILYELNGKLPSTKLFLSHEFIDIVRNIDVRGTRIYRWKVFEGETLSEARKDKFYTNQLILLDKNQIELKVSISFGLGKFVKESGIRTYTNNTIITG